MPETIISKRCSKCKTPKQLTLTQGRFALVDDEDFDLVSRFKWHVKDGYARTIMYLGMIGGKEKTVQMRLHRLIMRPPQHLQVDHINHNGFDCRRENMRICTNSENQQNRVPRKDTSSRFKGVCLHKAAAKWQAQIKLNGNRIYLAGFNDEAEAGMAYDTKAKELFGEFAHLNFPWAVQEMPYAP